MPDDGKVALLVIDNGAYCTTAAAREMVAVRMSDDDRCILSMTVDDKGQGGRWRAYPVTIWRNWSMTGTDRR
jgi:hypothetical protein